MLSGYEVNSPLVFTSTITKNLLWSSERVPESVSPRFNPVYLMPSCWSVLSWKCRCDLWFPAPEACEFEMRSVTTPSDDKMIRAQVFDQCRWPDICCNELGISGHIECENGLEDIQKNVHEKKLKVTHQSKDKTTQSTLSKYIYFFYNYENIYKSTNFQP